MGRVEELPEDQVISLPNTTDGEEHSERLSSPAAGALSSEDDVKSTPAKTVALM